MGALNFASRSAGAFPPETVGLLSRVAAQVAIALDNAFAYEEIQALKDQLAEENLYLQEEIDKDFGMEIVGRSPALQKVLRQVETVAPSDATVLLLGETGTGKELMARAIHALSPRAERSFVQINCAAIPLGLVESELLVMKRAPSPAPSPRRWAAWSWPTRARSSWTRSATCPWNCSPSCSAPCRSGSSNAWGGPAAARWTCA
jgi:formate hydrogenlyase transcriptional activator